MHFNVTVGIHRSWLAVRSTDVVMYSRVNVILNQQESKREGALSDWLSLILMSPSTQPKHCMVNTSPDVTTILPPALLVTKD